MLIARVSYCRLQACAVDTIGVGMSNRCGTSNRIINGADIPSLSFLAKTYELQAVIQHIMSSVRSEVHHRLVSIDATTDIYVRSVWRPRPTPEVKSPPIILLFIGFTDTHSVVKSYR